MWIDDRLVIDHWRQGWLPWNDVARVAMAKGHRYKVDVEWTKDQGDTCQVRWKTPVAIVRDTSLWSEVGDGIDYYFFYGPELDAVVAGYRRVTGEAPMMPRWAFGFWQSRERYKTQQESLDVLDGFRSRHIPIDVIVQDWQYWKTDTWGSHAVRQGPVPRSRRAGSAQIHDKHAKLMISVWGKFYPGTANFEAMHDAGLSLRRTAEGQAEGLARVSRTPSTTRSIPARARCSGTSSSRRSSTRAWTRGGWTRPSPISCSRSRRSKASAPTRTRRAWAPGARVLNGYSLVNSHGHLRRASAPRRPTSASFILTRSAFAGQQRYAIGDVVGRHHHDVDLDAEADPRGPGFSLSGVPYWATGHRRLRHAAALRAHAEDARRGGRVEGAERPLVPVQHRSRRSCACTASTPNREMWFLGGESDPAYQTELKFDRLRYRLLPYVYSLAGDVTHHAGTMLRPLVMDFRSRPDGARDRRPVHVRPGVSRQPRHDVSCAQPDRSICRRTRRWYDLWTGQSVAGGQPISAPAPYDTLPVHVRAGSIVPVGPDLEYTDEKPADPITLYVYAGADGAFTLYEDDGTTYGYEKGASAVIPIAWNDASGHLAIGARTGTFPGMLESRTFKVVLVSASSPVGLLAEPPTTRTVTYTGVPVTVDFGAK